MQMHVYMYIYTHTYTYIHIYTHTHIYIDFVRLLWMMATAASTNFRLSQPMISQQRAFFVSGHLH